MSQALLAKPLSGLIILALTTQHDKALGQHSENGCQASATLQHVGVIPLGQSYYRI